MNIKNIAILGAGAVGASIAHQIIRNTGTAQRSITLIADRKRADCYLKKGIRVNGDVIRPAAAQSGNYDLIIIATKSYHLEEAMNLLDSCMGKKTLLMSLLNGIASEGTLGERYGDEKIVPAMILGIDAQRDESGIRYANDGVIHYGVNPAIGPDTADSGSKEAEAAVSALDSWFKKTGLGHKKSSDITKTLWRKFMINVGANQASALFKAPYRELQNDTEARKLMFAAMEEVVSLSEKESTGLRSSDIEEWDEILQTLDPTGMTSMAQDAAAGRRMETGIFAGTVVAMAEKHGLDVPVNRMLLENLGG